MKNYFKKFSIMFLTLLVIIGLGIIQHGNVAKAATLGQKLSSVENGWTRYDDTNANISYIGNFGRSDWATNHTGTGSLLVMDALDTNGLRFNFTSNKLRLYGVGYPSLSGHNIISIDGKDYDVYAYNQISNNIVALTFDIENLSDGEHSVEIRSNGCKRIYLDALDIDKNGTLLPYNKALSLDNSSMELNVDDSKKLMVTTTPAAIEANLLWKSSDESIATVDERGNVTGIKEGQATITAIINDRSNLSASCTVNVTNPITPTITLNKTSDSLVAGQTDDLVATTTPAGAQVIWKSSDESIATVDSRGKVIAIKEGQVVITATTVDDLTATCAVTVTPKTTEPTNPDPDPTDSDKIINIAHAKGDNTNNAGGDVTIIFHGAADATLCVIKTADVKDVWVGDNFTYTIVVTNTGTKTAKAVVVNDPVPKHIDFSVNGVTTTQGTVDPSSTSKNIIVNVGDIAPGATVTIKVPATVIA